MTKKTKEKDEEYEKVLKRAIKLGFDTFGAKVFFNNSDDKFKKGTLKVVIKDNVFFFIGAYNYLDFLQKRIENRTN